MELEKALAKINEQMNLLKDGVFDSPPSDWAEFRRRQGEYLGLKSAAGCIQEALQEEIEE